jgi:hypothetical protein
VHNMKGVPDITKILTDMYLTKNGINWNLKC